MEILRLHGLQDLMPIIHKFETECTISGYQLYDLIMRKEQTEVYVIKGQGFNESIVIYKEFSSPAVIIRVNYEESLFCFLTFLQSANIHSFLLFVEGKIPETAICNSVSQCFGYEYAGKESVLALSRSSLNILDKTTASYKTLFKSPIADNSIVSAVKLKDFSIAHANESDLSGILALYSEFNERAYTETEHLDLVKNGFIYVLKEGQKVIGVACLHTSLPQVSIMGGFRINRHYQEVGLGSCLLRKVSEFILMESVHVLSYTPTCNYRMISLRRRMGYRPIAYRMAFAINTKLKPIIS